MEFNCERRRAALEFYDGRALGYTCLEHSCCHGCNKKHQWSFDFCRNCASKGFVSGVPLEPIFNRCEPVNPGEVPAYTPLSLDRQEVLRLEGLCDFWKNQYEASMATAARLSKEKAQDKNTINELSETIVRRNNRIKELHDGLLFHAEEAAALECEAEDAEEAAQKFSDLSVGLVAKQHQLRADIERLEQRWKNRIDNEGHLQLLLDQRKRAREHVHDTVVVFNNYTYVPLTPGFASDLGLDMHTTIKPKKFKK